MFKVYFRLYGANFIAVIYNKTTSNFVPFRFMFLYCKGINVDSSKQSTLLQVSALLFTGVTLKQTELINLCEKSWGKEALFALWALHWQKFLYRLGLLVTPESNPVKSVIHRKLFWHVK